MRRILVVDDDPLFGRLLKTWLEKEGYDAVIAETLEAGFVNIAAEPLPDAVLLDVHLGRKNGLTLVHWARKQKHLAHIYIVAVTGDASLRDMKSFHDAGCDACIFKPIDFDVLRKSLLEFHVHSSITIP